MEEFGKLQAGRQGGNLLMGAGMRVFRSKDDDENETISEMEAIKSSQLCVPVFLETFASSIMMMNTDGIFFCREAEVDASVRKAMMPIFYGVSRDVVKDVVMKKLWDEQEIEQEIEQWEHALGRKVIYKEGVLQQGALDTTHWYAYTNVKND
ncbi:hypothetical protein SAY86_029277 [Trapa natans]|uniref:Uncharacterized protein n=1 Tax=Trapa natans TaxID=22666 RepID=A0AAN7RFP9_TRANT|nr:hypothetical protein SAY86_029277 [Trapa natans]